MRVFILLSSLCFIPISFAETGVLLSVLSLDDATKTIIERNKSKVLAAKTISVEGKEVHVIKVLTEDGRVQHFKIDAESGRVVQ